MATVGEIAIVVGADVGPMVRELGKGKGALNDFGNAGSRMSGILGSAMGAILTRLLPLHDVGVYSLGYQLGSLVGGGVFAAADLAFASQRYSGAKRIAITVPHKTAP